MRTSPLKAFVDKDNKKNNKEEKVFTDYKSDGGFMHPPYKRPVGPTEKHHYVHGYKKNKKQTDQ